MGNFAGFSNRLFAASYDLLNSRVERYVSPYRRQTAGCAWGKVLEIGGGTGANIVWYSKETLLTFIEPSPYMIQRLKRGAAKAKRDVSLISGVGEELPFRDATFDSVVTTLTLCMVEAPDKLVQEVRRVLKPGGSFLFYEHVVSEKPWGRKLQSWINPAWKFFTTGCNLNRDLSKVIKNSGFNVVEIKYFDLNVGMPVTIPNIVGVAKVYGECGLGSN